jgi:hypothetical protein
MSRLSHQWETVGEKHMKIEEAEAPIYDLPPILYSADAERYAESLVKFPLEEIGSGAWMEQHRKIEKLNLQAHQSAMTNSDEYVLESILTFNKLDILVHDLLAIELWKENIFPLLLRKIIGRNSMRVYFILYHEASLVNLFEVLLYHKHICQAGGERMLELVDYVARKLTRLNSGFDFRKYDPSSSGTPLSAKEVADNLTKISPEDELLRHLTEMEFKICITACSMARLVCFIQPIIFCVYQQNEL